MPTLPAFDNTAPLGRLTLLIGAYGPALAVLGLRHGLDKLGIALCAAGAAAVLWWVWALTRFVRGRQAYELTFESAEPADRDVTAYVATYLLPVLSAKPTHWTGYAAYGLVALLILVVAYRADLGTINPLGYLLGYRAFRVSAEDGARIVLSRRRLVPGASWVVQEAAGIVVATEPVTTTNELDHADS
jgi:hypothetical protein